MSIRDARRHAAAVVVALACTSGVASAEPGERRGAVVAARVDLQRQMGDWLTRSLAGAAEPYTVEAVVRIDLQGFVREQRSRPPPAPPVKIEGSERIQLPGLGIVDTGRRHTNVQADPSGDVALRVSDTVTRQLETEVTRMRVLLLVDPAMPGEHRDALATLASDLAVLDRARGDEVVVNEKAPARSLPARSGPGLDVVLACATALVVALVLAFALRGGRGSIARVEGGVIARGGAQEGAAGAMVERSERGGPSPDGSRPAERGAFAALAGATPHEVVQVLAEADPQTAAAILDLVGLDADAAKLFETMVPPQHRVEIAMALAAARATTRAQLAGMEEIAAKLLERARDRVELGGPAKLAGFLAVATAEVRKHVLEGIAARDEALARSAREALLLFDDLPRLSDASLRQVVTGLDPATLAVALVGAREIRDRVHGVVSKRLRSILEAEEEAVTDRTASDVEGARRVVEDAIRELAARGELEARAA